MKIRNPLALSVAFLLVAWLPIIPTVIAGSDDQAIIAATKNIWLPNLILPT